MLTKDTRLFMISTSAGKEENMFEPIYQ